LLPLVFQAQSIAVCGVRVVPGDDNARMDEDTVASRPSHEP
jgi:hypothetical protein